MPDKTAASPAVELAEGCLVTARTNPVPNVSNSFSTPIQGVAKVIQTENIRGRRAVRLAKTQQEDGQEKLTPIPGTFYAEHFNPEPAA